MSPLRRVDPIEINVRVGRVVKALLSERGMTLAQLADHAVTDLSSLSRALNGQEGITLHRLERVASVLEKELHEIIRLSQESQ